MNKITARLVNQRGVLSHFSLWLSRNQRMIQMMNVMGEIVLIIMWKIIDKIH